MRRGAGPEGLLPRPEGPRRRPLYPSPSGYPAGTDAADSRRPTLAMTARLALASRPPVGVLTAPDDGLRTALDSAASAGARAGHPSVCSLSTTCSVAATPLLMVIFPVVIAPSLRSHLAVLDSPMLNVSIPVARRLASWRLLYLTGLHAPAAAAATWTAPRAALLPRLPSPASAVMGPRRSRNRP